MGRNSRLTTHPQCQAPKFFLSGSWKRGYNPDIGFVIDKISLICIKHVFDPVPQTQLGPIAIEIDTHIPALHTPFNRCFNLSKEK